ncbi:hypothetical protein [Acidisphaera sp. S103]|uniref:hypothetical protein n=1 Tax=Acidisphaera sp. S103 TaxID=1747223 RepID=UPI00131D51BB|nr:hypothetical protein [Acidisphaera sp. S103]
MTEIAQPVNRGGGCYMMAKISGVAPPIGRPMIDGSDRVHACCRRDRASSYRDWTKSAQSDLRASRSRPIKRRGIHVDAQTLTHQIVWQKAIQIDDAEPARRGCHVLHLAQGAATALATVGLSA